MNLLSRGFERGRMSTTYDIAIIGAGIAGAFASYKITKDFKNLKLLIVDIGRPPMKRRRQLEGWLGCFPGSDAKLYLNNLDSVANLIGKKSANSAFKEVKSCFNEISDLTISKNANPSVSFNKNMQKIGYDYQINNFSQIFPKEIHALSKKLSSLIDENPSVDLLFDEEVLDIKKDKKIFSITTDYNELKAKKIIFSPGRSGWRWAHQIYKKFGIVQNNNRGKYGIKIETDASILKDLNKSNCIYSKEKITLGPFLWNGTVIPEDHVDCAIASFRSNENRWKSDKVSFDLLLDANFENSNEEIDRITKLTFLLANDRIIKERLASLVAGKSKISIMKEYNWITEVVEELNTAMPNLISKSHFYLPTIAPLPSEINIYSNLETDVDGLFVAGESTGISGILSAACMGIAAAKFACKE